MPEFVGAEYYPKQSVEFEIEDGVLKGIYQTTIANLNDAALLLAVPQIGNLYVPIRVGHTLLLRYIMESWAHEAAVSVAARKDNAGVPIMLVSRPKLVQRKLLRKFVRVDAFIESNLHLIRELSDYGREKFADKDLTPVMIEDISGGGAKVRLPANFDVQDQRYALLWFTLPYVHKSFYNMLTRIKTVLDDKPPDRFLIVEFAGLSESERNDIVQYCHRRQVELGREK